MRIEERNPCPQCGHRRVVQRGKSVYVCFQCRNYWSMASSEAPPRDVLVLFQPERARRVAYRGAIRVGLLRTGRGGVTSYGRVCKRLPVT